MDRWMCRTIINRARVRTGCVHYAAAGGSLNRRMARQKIVDDDTNRYRIKNGNPVKVRSYGERSDHIRPLERWLRSRIGEDWDALWSEICKAADSRNVRGRHLRQHVEMLVETESLHIKRRGFRGFYVDPYSRKLQHK